MTPTPDPTAPGVELVPRRAATNTPAGMAARESLRLGRLGGYTFAEIQEIGNVVARAKMFRDLSPDQAIVKILAGLELGLPIIQAVGSLDVIDGGVSVRSNMMAAMVKRNPLYKYKIVEWDDEHCVVEWYERESKDDAWESCGPPTRFSMDDARRARLLDNPKKPAWQTYPRSMLRNRAIAEGARAYCGDALSNVYDADEVDPDEYTLAADYDRHVEKINRPRREREAAAAGETIDGEADEVIDIPSQPSPESDAPETSETSDASAPSSATAPPPEQPTSEEEPPPGDDTAPIQSLVDIVGSTPAEPGWRPITQAQAAHFRTIALPLDSTGISKVVAWATRDDGSHATSDLAQLREPRYQELKHLLENAPKGHPDRAELVRRVSAWIETLDPDEAQGTLV